MVIYKQKNGLYCIYSPIVSGIVFYDATREQLIEYLLSKSRDEIVMFVDNGIKAAESREIEGKAKRDMLKLGLL